LEYPSVHEVAPERTNCLTAYEKVHLFEVAHSPQSERQAEHKRFDPSAASFKTELRNRGFRIKDADNDVRNGISKVSTMFALKKLLINKKCRYLINELHGYIWDDKPAERGIERPVKTNDHACGALRYGIETVIYSKRRFAK
jgi:phage terminase large subunit